MPTPQRIQHNTPAMRKNPSLSRNGGSDAEIMELNQQVELNCIVFLLLCFVSCLLEEYRFPKSMVQFRTWLLRHGSVHTLFCFVLGFFGGVRRVTECAQGRITVPFSKLQYKIVDVLYHGFSVGVRIVLPLMSINSLWIPTYRKQLTYWSWTSFTHLSQKNGF